MNKNKKNNKKKLIIFGGSFDPIHKGHIKIAKQVFLKLKADKLLFVPANIHPQKKAFSSDIKHRIKMLELIISPYHHFEICDYEINSNEVSYTVNTVKYLKERYSDYEAYLLIGYDQLINFKTWKDYEQILSLVKLVAYKRVVNKKLLKEIDFEYISLGKQCIKCSSSSLKSNPDKKYLDKRIINYINENGLYIKERLFKVMSEYRLNHCLEVGNIAKDLAIHHKLYPLVNKAYIAGIYHDYAKEIDKEIQVKIAKKLKIKNYVSWTVLHGYVGAYLIQKQFHMDDYQILLAIKSHTIPFDFSSLSKIVYIADKIALRNDGFNDLRAEWKTISYKDLNEGFNTIHEFHQKLFDRDKEKLNQEKDKKKTKV